jgi:N-acetylmuramoyl-L-alanine amidase
MKTKTLITLIILIILITGGAVYGQGDIGEKEPGGHAKVVTEHRQELKKLPKPISTYKRNFGNDLGSNDSSNEQITPTEYKLLIKITYLEARGESLEGKTAVVRTILNRVESKAFPDSIEEVIYQPGQFQPAKYLQEVEVEEEYLEEIEKAVIAALKSDGEELYFVNPEYANANSYSWMANSLTFLYRIGNHEFYR